MEKLSSTPTQDRERLVIIPTNYEMEGVVPICISTIDDEGLPVHRGWIDAVRNVADPLRALARRVIGEVWQVSELAEGSVHALNRKHGEQLGRSPASQIYADASWRAKDLAAGSRRARSGRDVELKKHLLECLKDPHDFEHAYEDREYLEHLEEKLWAMGKTDVLTMLYMHQTGAKDLISEVFGIRKNSRARNALSQRFRRTVDKALKLL
jgi:hypothetical protein